ncbi:NAD(P)/FAD-dependent oxidoreductase [candidate division WOR-3 bacterium]|nr:NAD(P)/FAD-dependent oxidoreductase [candidate division WOR-3 bacterium]
MDFDFIIVGAGPVGSFLAKSLAEEGCSVGVFDRKREVGEGVICSGIIGKDAYDKFNLPGKAIIRKISSLKVFSPSLIELRYDKEEPFAYIADRKIFDRELVGEASKAGAEIFLESNVFNIEKEKDRVLIKYSKNGGEFQKSARCIIIASGTNFTLHRKIGFSSPENILWGNRVEAIGGDGNGSVEVYILSKPDLSSFGWIIPLSGHTRIGALSAKSSRESLETLIYKSNGRFNVDMDKVEKAPIACGNSKKISGERVIAVGEAAGQVKTTTGGGIYYGLIGASIAKEILLKAAKTDNFSDNTLKEYERIWAERMGDEIRNGIMVRNVASKINSQLVDNVFDFLKKNPSIKEDLESRFSFDYHQDIIKSGIKFFLNKIPKKFFSFNSPVK